MKRKVKCWMIGSYFLVLAVFLLVYLAIQQQTEKKFKELYSEGQAAVMHQTMLAVNEQVEAVRKMCFSIAQEPYVQYFPFVGKELSRYDRESVTKLLQSIRRHYTDNPFVEDIYLFYENSGRIAHANGFYREDDFYLMEWCYEDEQIQNQGKELLRQKGSFFLPSAWMNNGAKRTENITFFYEIGHSLGNREGKAAKLVVLLKKEWMDEMILPISENGKTSIQSAYNGEELYCVYGEGFPVDDFLKLEETKENVNEWMDEGRFLLTRLEAEKTGWIYETIVPYTIITVQVKEAVRPMSLGLFFYLLLGIPACFLLAVWNYKPIRQLTAHIEEIGLGGEGEHENELEYIQTGISHLKQKYEELKLQYNSTRQAFDSASRKLIKNRERLQEGILLQLIGGYWRDKKEMEEKLCSMGISFSYPRFCLVAVEVEEDALGRELQTGGNASEAGVLSAEEMDLRLFVLKNVAQEFLEPIGRVIPVSADAEQIYLVINLAEDNPEEKQEENREESFAKLERLLREMMDYFQKELQMMISIGVGLPCDQLRQLNVSFKQAKQALEYGFILGRPSLIHYGQVKREDKEGVLSEKSLQGKSLPEESPSAESLQEKSYYHKKRFDKGLYNSRLEKQLWARLLQKDEEGCQRLLAEFYQEILEQKISVKEGRGLHMLLTDMAMRAVEQANLGAETAEVCQDMVAKLLNSKTLPQVFQVLGQLFAVLCVQRKETGGEQELTGQIMQVIEASYQNPDFSLAQCADHFGISSEHLSRTVKQLTGRKFVDIVNGLRLERAKNYLLETDLKMEEIAALSGYGTVKSFFRSFKQAEGVPPGVWRKGKKESRNHTKQSGNTP